MSMYNPDGYIVVAAVDDESSLVEATSILDSIDNTSKPLFLVANKVDLLNTRVLQSGGTKEVLLLFHYDFLLILKISIS